MAPAEEIELKCPACGATFLGTLEDALAPLSCPKCSQVVTFEPAEPVAATQTPQPPPPQETSPLDALAAAASEAAAPAAARPVQGSGICPSCHYPLEPGAVICVNCGRHLKTGLNAKTIMRARKAKSIGAAVATGAVAAVIAGAIWAGIVVATEYEVGYVACGVGFLTGLAVRMTTSERSGRIGAVAAGLAVCGLLIGKLMIAQWGLPGLVRKEFEKNEDEANALALALILMDTPAEPDVEAWYESDTDEKRPSDPALARKVEQYEKKVNDKLEAMTEDEKLDMVVEAVMEEVPLADRLEASFSPYDILWFLFAIAVAWRMGTRSEGGG